MYCIITTLVADTMYLAWQDPVWDDDGYFWTWKDVFEKCLHNNVPEHPFLFQTREEAQEFMEKLKSAWKYEIVEYPT